MIGRKINILVILFIVAVIAIPAAFADISNNASVTTARPVPTPTDTPPFSSYKGVAIGATLDDARAKLGNPKEKGDGQDSFEFSDHESAQIYYDASKKVTAIMLTYTGKLDNAPTPKAVFGEDAEVKPDGGIFKMERYPKAGFWISYNKTGGDDPIVIIAINKI